MGIIIGIMLLCLALMVDQGQKAEIRRKQPKKYEDYDQACYEAFEYVVSHWKDFAWDKTGHDYYNIISKDTLMYDQFHRIAKSTLYLITQEYCKRNNIPFSYEIAQNFCGENTVEFYVEREKKYPNDFNQACWDIFTQISESGHDDMGQSLDDYEPQHDYNYYFKMDKGYNYKGNRQDHKRERALYELAKSQCERNGVKLSHSVSTRFCGVVGAAEWTAEAEKREAQEAQERQNQGMLGCLMVVGIIVLILVLFAAAGSH